MTDNVVTGALRTERTLFAGLGSVLARYLACKRTYAELERLSDTTLSDIGLSRWEIAMLAREEAREAL